MAHHVAKHSIHCCFICCCSDDGCCNNGDESGEVHERAGSSSPGDTLVNKDMLRMVAARAPQEIGIGLGEGVC